jgi:hypothetical protein
MLIVQGKVPPDLVGLDYQTPIAPKSQGIARSEKHPLGCWNRSPVEARHRLSW